MLHAGRQTAAFLVCDRQSMPTLDLWGADLWWDCSFLAHLKRGCVQVFGKLLASCIWMLGKPTRASCLPMTLVIRLHLGLPVCLIPCLRPRGCSFI
jgi:hypothetical protein